jgi:NAD(P)-dependent dehydrogenase (short-subunit alcohol dehydrogenase family)
MQTLRDPRERAHPNEEVEVSEYRFEGRVAVVTGAGRGIGRAHARLLAERGASVVVNDLGGTMEGVGSNVEPAREVVDEIVAAGGAAAPDFNDVSTSAGGQAIIDTALREFGRIDIVVNNAGTVRWGALPEVDADNMEHALAVHTMGSFHTVHAAWPHMVEQGYGRIVMTTSTGVFGLPDNTSYAAAKAAVIGMSRSIAIAGEPHNIKINNLAPNASTRMGGPPADGRPTSIDIARSAGSQEQPLMTADLVSPMVAFLAHEDCPVSGEVYAAGANRFSRIFLACTPGYLHSDGLATVEDVAENWDAVNDETDYYVPSGLFDWSGHYMAHLYPGATA